MPSNLKLTALAAALAVAVASGCAQDDPVQLLQEAHTAFAKGEFKTAEIHLKNLLQAQSDNAKARLLLAKTYIAGRHWPLAEKEFLRALELGASQDEVAPGLMEAMYRSQDVDGLLEQARKLRPQDPAAKAEVAVWSAHAWLQQGDSAKARAAFEEALVAVPSLVRARVGLLGIEAAESPEAQARVLKEVDALLVDAPDSREALMLQARLRLSAGDLEDARVPLQAIIAAAPADVEARSTLVMTDLLLQDREAARTHLAELLQRTPKWPVALTHKARLDLLDGNQEAARDAARSALDIAPDYLPALGIAGNTSLALDALEQAENYARQIIKLAPQSKTGHRLLAATLLKRQEPGRALQVIEPLLLGNPDDPELLVMAGEAALRDGDATASAGYFARAASLDKDDPRKRVGLALARIGTGDRAGAMAELESATAMETESTRADQILVATLIAERRFDDALAAIDALEKKQPAPGEVSLLRGRVALARGDTVKARSHLEQALLDAPSLLPAVAVLAALDVKDGKPDAARERFDALVKQDPDNVRALLALAKLTADTGGMPADVLALLGKAHDADPGSEIAAVAYAQGLVTAGRAGDAVRLLEAGIEAHSGWHRAPETLAAAYMRAGEKERARGVIERIAQARPDDARAQLRAGRLYTALGDSRAALERHRRARILQPDAIEPRVNIGLSQARLGRLDDAHATAQALQKDFPQSSAGWALDGELFRASQKWREAAESFGKAAALEPALGAHAFKQHDSLVRAGVADEADKLMKGWLAASPKNEQLNLYLGERALGRQDYAEAARRYEIAAAANPDNVVARNNQAWALHQLKDPGALAIAEEAYRRAPNAPAVVDTLASILDDGSQPQRVLELRRRAAALAPSSADLRLRFAQALQASNDKEAARKEFDAISRDFPGTPQAATASRLSAEL